MAIVTNTVCYLDGDVLLEGCFAYDDTLSGIRPAVLVFHAWGGRDEFVVDKARKLAELGYLGFAVDMYGQGVRGRNPEENAELMRPFIVDRAMLQKRAQAALQAVKQLPWTDNDKVGAIGFCFGGMCALDLARIGAKLCGTVSFHGLLAAPGNVPDPVIAGKVLVLHGYDDPMVPVDQVLALQNELTRAGADWQFHCYGHTMHAFTNPVANNPAFGTVYQPVADRRSWQAMQNFLSEIFA